MTGRGFTQPLMWNKKERKKRRQKGEDRVCGGKDRKERKTTEKGQGGIWGNRERERERAIRKV